MKRLGSEPKNDIKNLLSGGSAEDGFSGFTYYSETCSFYDINRVEIKALLSELAESLGEKVLDMVRDFGCLTDKRENKPLYSFDEIGEVIYGTGSNESIRNALAWFALEEVSRMFDK